MRLTKMVRLRWWRQKAANARYRRARAELDQVGEWADQDGRCGETDEFHRKNQAVLDAERDASWWLAGRWLP